MALTKEVSEQLVSILQDYVNLDYDQLVKIGKECFNTVVNNLLNVFDQDGAYISVLALISSSIIADGELTEKEIQFLTDVSGLDKDTIINKVYPLGTREQAKKIANTICDCDIRELADDAFTLAICLLAVDESITRTEYEYIAELLEK